MAIHADAMVYHAALVSSCTQMVACQVADGLVALLSMAQVTVPSLAVMQYVSVSSP